MLVGERKLAGILAEGVAGAPPLVIVGIDHGELRRAREYLPVEDDRNPYAREPLAPEYASFVTTELMPFIEREYPVAHGASNTAFGGSSYGAVATLFTAMTHPGMFGRLLHADRKSTRLNSSHSSPSRMPSTA